MYVCIVGSFMKREGWSNMPLRHQASSNYHHMHIRTQNGVVERGML